jgi:hypothetical protein
VVQSLDRHFPSIARPWAAVVLWFLRKRYR